MADKLFINAALSAEDYLFIAIKSNNFKLKKREKKMFSNPWYAYKNSQHKEKVCRLLFSFLFYFKLMVVRNDDESKEKHLAYLSMSKFYSFWWRHATIGNSNNNNNRNNNSSNTIFKKCESVVKNENPFEEQYNRSQGNNSFGFAYMLACTNTKWNEVDVILQKEYANLLTANGQRATTNTPKKTMTTTAMQKNKFLFQLK